VSPKRPGLREGPQPERPWDAILNEFVGIRAVDPVHPLPLRPKPGIGKGVEFVSSILLNRHISSGNSSPRVIWKVVSTKA